jgi:hypothetical protein
MTEILVGLWAGATRLDVAVLAAGRGQVLPGRNFSTARSLADRVLRSLAPAWDGVPARRTRTLARHDESAPTRCSGVGALR